MTAEPGRSRILVMRRDNIGDLVCTTPLIRSLRAQLPQARIVALVNRYNEPVLAGNPDLDAVHSYQKTKHRVAGESIAGLYARRLRTLFALRRERFEWLLLPGGAQASALRVARLIAPHRLLVREAQDGAAGPHEVQQSCNLLGRMGLNFETPRQRVVADPAATQALAATVRARLGFQPASLTGVHVSARKASQRWPAERFAELLRRLPAAPGSAFVLLWAPGSERNPLHPGDDEKAARIASALPGRPLVPVATHRLDELISALALCDRMVCADGGAMHIAAALGKPIVCLFGDSDAARWHPWQVPHELLQPPSRNVADIMVEDVMHAYERLCEREGTGA